MSEYRLRLETAAGGFATLLAFIPWEVLKAFGAGEASAAYISSGLLLSAALGALALRRAPFAQKEFYVEIYRETFHVPNFLRAFGLFALAELALAGGLLLFLLAYPS